MKKIIASIVAFATISCNAQEKQFSKKALETNLIAKDSKKEISFSEILKKHDSKSSSHQILYWKKVMMLYSREKQENWKNDQKVCEQKFL